MPSLEDDFGELAARLTQAATLVASRSDPIFYFVYPPDQAMAVKQSLPVWIARLRNAGLQVAHVSFADLLWDIVDRSGRWDAWLEAEADFTPEEVNAAIQSLLGNGTGLIARVAALVDQERPGTVVFLTDTELLHPYFRVRTLESSLHDRVKVPTVVFYPGRRRGLYGLSFLGLYLDDSNYRATLIGGLP